MQTSRNFPNSERKLSHLYATRKHCITGTVYVCQFSSFGIFRFGLSSLLRGQKRKLSKPALQVFAVACACESY